jgi:ATP-dependent DNA ligase
MTYDPDSYTGEGCMPTLFTKTANGAINQWTVKAEGRMVVARWGQVGGKLQETSVEAKPKNIGRANATTAEQQAVLEAISQWKKKCKKKYFLTPDEASAPVAPRAMLAKSGKEAKKLEEKLAEGADVQPKFDGLRDMVWRNPENGNLVLQSRGNDTYDVAHIRDALAPFLQGRVMLDGELYIHGVSLQTITSLVRRPQEASLQLVYCVYDMVELTDGAEKPWSERREHLAAWFSQARQAGLPICIQPVQTERVHTIAEVEQWHDAFVAAGYEGAIIRLPGGKYRFGHRSSELLKWKKFQDAEFTIVNFTNGKGKFEHYPIFRCRTEEGMEFDVMPKGTDAERRQMLKDAMGFIGKQLTVRFFDWTDDRVPHFPVGIAIREPGT